MAKSGTIYLTRTARKGQRSDRDKGLEIQTAEDVDFPPLCLSIVPTLAVFIANFVLVEPVLPRLDLQYLADPAWGGVAP